MIKYGLATSAAVGATGTGIWYSGILSNTYKDVSHLIKEDKTIVLVKNENDWNEKWEIYKTDNAGKGAGKDVWNLAGWSDLVPSTILETFKSRCSSILSEKIKDKRDTKYREAVKYCTRDKKISDLFLENKVTLLPKDNGNDEKWKTRWEKFKEASGASLLGFTIVAEDTKENSFSKLSAACEAAFNKPVKEAGYLNNFESIKKWCSSESTFE